jgi:hypothetical protein
MYTLIFIIVTSAGQVSVQTLPFASERTCEAAAQKIQEQSAENFKVTTVCIDRGLPH